jgi:hypothetical protein
MNPDSALRRCAKCEKICYLVLAKPNNLIF